MKRSSKFETQIAKFYGINKPPYFIAIFLVIMGCQSTSNGPCAADNLTRVAANGDCLVIQSYGSPDQKTKLIVFIHGDGSSGGSSDYLYSRAERYGSQGVVSVGLIRPGYFDSAKNHSTGYSNRFTGDGYGSSIIDTVADAVRVLKKFYKAEHVVLVGHSGGAAISGVILGKFPGLADSAVLAACPCNVPEWRIMRSGRYNWGSSLSPHSYADDVPKSTKVIAVTGSNDSNTQPIIASEYIELLKRNGIKATYIEAPSTSHNGITSSQEFSAAIEAMLGTN